MWAAGRVRSPLNSFAGSGRLGRGDRPVGQLRRGGPRTIPRGGRAGRTRPSNCRSPTPRSTGAGPAGGALHDRSGGRTGRDGPRHPARWCGRRLRLGSRRERRAALAVLACGARPRPERPRGGRSGRGRARGIAGPVPSRRSARQRGIAADGDPGFKSFDDWWDPFTLGVGPAGAYVAGLAPDAAAALRNRCEQLLPPAPFEVTASAWCVLARR